MKRTALAQLSVLPDRQPAHASVAGLPLVVVRFDTTVSVLYGRCLHRTALLADGYVNDDNLVCGLHDWDYRLDSGVSAYNHAEALQKFAAWVEDERACGREHLSRFKPDDLMTWKREMHHLCGVTYAGLA